MTPVGAPGVVAGVTKIEVDAAPSPFALTAFKYIVYEVPFVSPVIVTGLAVEPIDA